MGPDCGTAVVGGMLTTTVDFGSYVTFTGPVVGLGPVSIKANAHLVDFSPAAGGPVAVTMDSLELDDGYLLIDTGWGSAESFAALEKGLADRGIAWSDIRTVLVTHLHPDHVGNVQEVLDRSGARYLMHRFEFEYWRDRSVGKAQRAVFEDSVRPVVDAGQVVVGSRDALGRSRLAASEVNWISGAMPDD